MNKWMITAFLMIAVYFTQAQTDFAQHEDDSQVEKQLLPQEAPPIQTPLREINTVEPQGNKSITDSYSPKTKRNIRQQLKDLRKTLNRTAQSGNDFSSDDLLLLLLAVILAILILSFLPNLLWLLVLVILAYLLYVFLLQ